MDLQTGVKQTGETARTLSGSRDRKCQTHRHGDLGLKHRDPMRGPSYGKFESRWTTLKRFMSGEVYLAEEE